MADKILSLIEEQQGITKEFLLSPSRKGDVALIRAMCIHILLKVEKFGPLDVGAVLNRDHSTALHGEKLFKDMYDIDHDGYCEKYDNLISKYLFDKENRTGDELEFYDSLRVIEDEIKKLEKAKNELISSKIDGANISPKTFDIINKILPENDKRTIIEQNIANGIRVI